MCPLQMNAVRLYCKIPPPPNKKKKKKKKKKRTSEKNQNKTEAAFNALLNRVFQSFSSESMYQGRTIAVVSNFPDFLIDIGTYYMTVLLY